jgi:hypothetical protein
MADVREADTCWTGTTEIGTDMDLWVVQLSSIATWSVANERDWPVE